jgi:hypothetical protein
MFLETEVKNTLAQLGETLGEISEGDYTKPCDELNRATIGKHYRHILEIFECLLAGYDEGIVSYDTRKRDLSIEQDKNAALQFINVLTGKISVADKPLRVTACYTHNHDSVESFDTSYHRELAYALEHAVHHMAILKIGFRFIVPGLELPEHFGVAASTIRHRAAVGQ